MSVGGRQKKVRFVAFKLRPLKKVAVGRWGPLLAGLYAERLLVRWDPHQCCPQAVRLSPEYQLRYDRFPDISVKVHLILFLVVGLAPAHDGADFAAQKAEALGW